MIPVLSYPDVSAAVAWLTQGLGFVERVRIGEHRAQLSYRDADLVIGASESAVGTGAAHEVMLRVADVDATVRTAVAHGAVLVQEPADFPYGERQAGITDPSGHRWTLSQSIADVAPDAWGGTAVQPR